jgi:dihydroorotate dehydrogenase electron transfer subunit
VINQVAEVLSYKKLGDEYHSIVVVGPEIAEAARPGQFVNLRPPRGRSFILRRPYSIYRVSRRAGGGPRTIEVMFDVRGPGSEALAALRPHDLIDVVGPVGRGFTIPTRQYSCLLVGGGIGATPLFFLADELLAAGKRVDVLWGGARASRLLNPIEAKRIGTVSDFATDDGSVGHHGLVTELLAEMIERCGTEVVYACGPHGMLRETSRIAVEHDVPVQVAVEELMGCGIGVCMTCVTPVFTREGTHVTYARTCVDGPVFNGARVAWEAVPRSEPAVPAGN